MLCLLGRWSFAAGCPGGTGPDAGDRVCGAGWPRVRCTRTRDTCVRSPVTLRGWRPPASDHAEIDETSSHRGSTCLPLRACRRWWRFRDRNVSGCPRSASIAARPTLSTECGQPCGHACAPAGRTMRGVLVTPSFDPVHPVETTPGWLVHTPLLAVRTAGRRRRRVRARLPSPGRLRDDRQAVGGVRLVVRRTPLRLLLRLARLFPDRRSLSTMLGRRALRWRLCPPPRPTRRAVPASRCGAAPGGAGQRPPTGTRTGSWC